MIAVADEAFRSLGLSGFRLELTSLGDETCRPEYRERLQEFLAGLDLDEATRERSRINPLRVLDDKRPEVRAQLENAPLMIDHLSESSAEHFQTVRSHLDALGVAYEVNPRMVRGLDYYTKTTFEFVHDGLGAQSGIGGGGRYDGLMEQLGGQPLSGIGFGIGVDRTMLALRAEGIDAAAHGRGDVHGVGLGAPAKAALVPVLASLRRSGLRADMAYGDRGMKGAFRAADRSGAAVTVVVGEDELASGTAVVKTMDTGEQHPVPLDSVVSHIAGLIEP